MDKEKVLNRIKKCLALSKSANEHEAALALKQAQALMRKYSVNDEDIALLDIREHICTSKTDQNIPGWQVMLANVVASAFGCEWYLGGTWRDRRIHYYGIGNKAELAAYGYEVLLHQVKDARKEYIATALKRVRLAKNKTYRADEFCKGWILSVYEKVDKFANGERERTLLQQFGQKLNLRNEKTREINASSHAKQAANIDRFLGGQEGKKAQLNHAMNAGEQLKQIT